MPINRDPRAMSDNIFWTISGHADAMEHGPRMHRIAVPWKEGRLELACRLRQNPSSDQTLVLLHGLGCSQRSFAGVWREEAFDACNVLSLDLPGFGDSDRPEDFSYRLEDHASLLAEFLQLLGLPGIHLLGHSMGGAVAVLAASRLPRLRTLIAVEGTLIAEDCGVSRVVAGMTRQRFEREFFPDFKTRTPPLHRAYLALELAEPHAFYRTADSLWSWARSDKLLQQFLDLKVPRLYVHGRRNKNLPVLDRLEGVQHSAVPNSGHFPMNENPGGFYHTLARWCGLLEQQLG